jgi:hypothetical protein
MFARSHDEPEPNTFGLGVVYRDGGATVPARQPVPPSGLHRAQAIGGYDGLGDEADSGR